MRDDGNKFFRLIKTICNSWAFFILSGVDLAFISIYMYTSRNLIKPSGLIEVIKFLINHTKDYGSSLLVGLLAYIIMLLLFFATVANTIVYFLGENHDNLIVAVLKIIIGIGLLILSLVFLKGLGSIALLAVIILAMIYLFFSSQ